MAGFLEGASQSAGGIQKVGQGAQETQPQSLRNPEVQNLLLRLS